MYVNNLSWDDFSRQGEEGFHPDQEDTVINNPNWNQIKEIFDNLDGDTRSLMIVKFEDEEHSFIAGGGGTSNSLYTVEYCDGETCESTILTDPTKSRTDTIKLMTGQLTEKEAYMCVDKKTALKALKTFSRVGELHSKLSWETV